MKRSNYLMLSTFLGLAACNGDDGANATNSDSNSGSASDSGTDSNTDSNGSDSNSGTESGTESSGSDSNSGGSGSSTDSAGTDSNSSGTTDSSGSGTSDSAGTTNTTTDGTGGSSGGGTGSTGGTAGGTAGTTTGGEQTGLCDEPGLVVGCYTHNPATQGVGECKDGTQVCVAIDLDLGEWSECSGDKGPSLEVCDGKDNDCDGMIDEDQGEINCGLGICNHSEPACVNGMPGSCDPFEGAMPEVCDGIDNDCDGDIDEGLGNDSVDCGMGKCEHSVTACMGGMEPECDPFEGATDEVCNGIDDDCDGEIDEGFGDLMCGQGQCAKTVPECVNGVPQTCDPFEGADNEICDGIDNDCDGLIDEDLGDWVCGEGLCQNSVPKCLNGVPQPEDTCEPGGTVEICGDGIDNDCDGDAPPCGESYQVGTDTAERPIDVIWAIDSSGSMALEMDQVEQEINNFANALDASGSSNALHLIVDKDTAVDGGNDFEMCVAPPLGGAMCADNPPNFWHYDTNGTGESMVHSSNALGRIMQQWKGDANNPGTGWGDRLQSNSFIAFIVTTDDDGDDFGWVGPDDDSETDDCWDDTTAISDGVTGNYCLWNDGNQATDFTSLADDHNNRFGFKTFMSTYFPNMNPGTDWQFYSIIGATGGTMGGGGPDNGLASNLQFSCGSSVETGQEYVKLSQFTGTEGDMIPICAPTPWPLAGLADAIANSVPQDTYVLTGSPPGTCGNIDPATIVVYNNGIPMNPADWTYDAMTCTLKINNNIPQVGDNVLITYENF